MVSVSSKRLGLCASRSSEGCVSKKEHFLCLLAFSWRKKRHFLGETELEALTRIQKKDSCEEEVEELKKMHYQQLGRTSCKDTLKVLEADIQHANALAAAIPNAKGGAHLQMKLVYNDLAPFVLFFLQWMDCSCTCFLPKYLNLFHILVCKVYADGRPKISTRGRKASIKDFYAVILPSLHRLHYDLVELDGITNDENHVLKSAGNKRLEGGRGSVNFDAERDDECGICLETCAKIVLPNCCHAMCINCYRDWNSRSESCPFCRGTISRVNSGDLWVLTSKEDIVDPETVYAEDLRQFYLYIQNLPQDSPEALFLMYYEYLI